MKLEKTLYLSKLDTQIAICCYESLGKNLGKSDNLIFDSKNLKKGNNKTSKFFVSNIIKPMFSCQFWFVLQCQWRLWKVNHKKVDDKHPQISVTFSFNCHRCCLSALHLPHGNQIRIEQYWGKHWRNTDVFNAQMYKWQIVSWI